MHLILAQSKSKKKKSKEKAKNKLVSQCRVTQNPVPDKMQIPTSHFKMPNTNTLYPNLLPHRPPTMPSPADTKENHLHLDGSTLEAGGQLLRNALTLAALTSRPVTIHSIRASRPEKGLKAMHLPPIKFIAETQRECCRGCGGGIEQVDVLSAGDEGCGETGICV